MDIGAEEGAEKVRTQTVLYGFWGSLLKGYTSKYRGIHTLSWVYRGKLRAKELSVKVSWNRANVVPCSGYPIM